MGSKSRHSRLHRAHTHESKDIAKIIMKNQEHKSDFWDDRMGKFKNIITYFVDLPSEHAEKIQKPKIKAK